jgi:hypothetical protein
MFALKIVKVEAFSQDCNINMIQRLYSESRFALYRNLSDFELMDSVFHGTGSVRIISEVQRKFTLNFNNFHLFKMEIFDNRALFEFYPR